MALLCKYTEHPEEVGAVISVNSSDFRFAATKSWNQMEHDWGEIDFYWQIARRQGPESFHIVS